MHGINWYIVGFGLIVIVLGFLWIRKKLRASLKLQIRLQKEFVALQQEKKIIYDFLHDLGEAFTEDIDRDHLLRIIVTCARKVTGAKGAAIYLWDADREKLVAAIVNGMFPPVLKVDNIGRPARRAHREPGGLCPPRSHSRRLQQRHRRRRPDRHRHPRRAD
jgi:hypothetical protein